MTQICNGIYVRKLICPAMVGSSKKGGEKRESSQDRNQNRKKPQLSYQAARHLQKTLHKCHYDCLVTWIDTPLNRDRNPYCPVCRLEFKSIKKTSTFGAEDEDIQLRDQIFF